MSDHFVDRIINLWRAIPTVRRSSCKLDRSRLYNIHPEVLPSARNTGPGIFAHSKVCVQSADNLARTISTPVIKFCEHKYRTLPLTSRIDRLPLLSLSLSLSSVTPKDKRRYIFFKFYSRPCRNYIWYEEHNPRSYSLLELF